MATPIDSQPDSAQDLRWRAEEKVRAFELKNLGALSTEDIVRLLHELQVHQIELEMQNEELRQAQIALAAAHDRYLDLYDFAPVGYLTLRQPGIIQEANLTAAEMLGIARSRLLGRPFSRFVVQEDSTAVHLNLRLLFKNDGRETFEVRLLKKEGEPFDAWVEATSKAEGEGRFIRLTISDITEHKRLEAENKQLLAQFFQAQKMQTIGRLAGGIAHDFNNLLVPIIGYAELSILKLTPDDPLYVALKQIKEAGERAAKLTQQILAFGRRQMMEMKPLDLNLVISEFAQVLRHLIGETIELQTRLSANLPSIKGDKGQLEQVMLNLVVNARDAMPDGGRLIIETAHATLNKVYISQQHLGIRSGEYALLTISDTGHGMDADTKKFIFEPFFTTKPVGQGTGLGLSVVFGVIKQHQGDISVDSAPGKGTTFKIYLPATSEPILTEEITDLKANLTEGRQTVLLVEDEPHVRLLISDILRTYGCDVLVAEGPIEGLELGQTHQGRIDLLLTDVIMPHFNGRELYQQLALMRPNLKVLYISGYTNDIIAHQGVLDYEVTFLQKPFSIDSLLEKVRLVLSA